MRAGLLWHDHPRRMAAAGSDTISFVLMMEEWRAWTPPWPLPSGDHSAVQPPLLQFGTMRRRKKYLTRMRGRNSRGVCLTEPQRFRCAGIQTRAVSASAASAQRDEDLVTNGSVAVASSFSRDESGSGAGKGITAFLVRRASKAFAWPARRENGQLSSPSVEIILNDCEVPAGQSLG